MKLKLVLISIFSLSAIFAQCDEAGGNSSWLGDGWCDSSNNNEACGWDLGDCCPNDCADNVGNGCPDAGGCYAGDGILDYCGDCSSCSDPNSQDYEDCGGTGTGGTGDTGGDTGGDCEAGYIEDCSGDGDCGPESWVGDGYCDGDAQEWGINNCCYDNDGGDCTPEECSGTGTGGDTGGDTGGGDPTGAPTNVNATGDFGSVTVSWNPPNGGGGTGGGDTGGDPEGVGEACTDAYGYPGQTDCQLQCVNTETINAWLGDGLCDDGTWGVYLDCDYYNMDNGDCDGGGTTTGGTTGGGGATCAGYCGSAGSDGSCYCDDLCEYYGDCCADYYDECAGGTTDGGTTGGGTTGGGNAPDGWTCDDSYYLDGWCDCGCGVYDLDCDDPNAQLWENCDEGFSCGFGETECSELQSCEDQGLVTCWDGSCANSTDDCPDEPYAGQDCCELVDCNSYTDYVGLILDCSLQYCFPSEELGDGACTDYAAAGYPGVGFNCEDLAFDNGDCEGVDPNECPAGYVDNCNPGFDGASACCAESWIGDGYCDGEDQAYGCDLLCYEGEDTDCSGGVQVDSNTPSRMIFEKENGLKSVNAKLTKEQFELSIRSQRVRKEFYSASDLKRPYSHFLKMVASQSMTHQNNSNRELLGYNVYRDGVMVASDIPTNNTLFTDYEVMANTEYCYQVSAIYTEGESELSGSACATSLGEPDAMLNFSGSAASGSLDVQMSSSVDVAGFQFVLTGGTVTGASGGMAEDAGFQISSSEDGIVLGFSFDGSTIPAGDGSLVTVNFDYEGIVDICMETVVLSDSNGEPISVGVGGCESTEMTVVMGDVNGDLSINVLDILVIVNSIVGGETLSLTEFEAADMNYDGSANVVDIIAIVNIILGDGSAMGTSINESTITVESENITIKSDGFIAGFELDVDGDFTLDNSQLPIGWSLYHSDSKVLAFTTDGKNLSDQITIPYEGSIDINSGLITDLHSTIVYAETNVIPNSYVVSTAYPNPFNPITQFDYAIPENVNVSISIYDASGSKIAEIQNGFQNAGSYTVSWDAGIQPSGVYFIRFVAGEYKTSEKVMLLK